MTERRVLAMDSRLAAKKVNYGAEGLIYMAREHVMNTGTKAGRWHHVGTLHHCMRGIVTAFYVLRWLRAKRLPQAQSQL